MTEFSNSQKWVNECKYISRITETRDLSQFNNDLACFIRYCEMQRDSAEREKFFDSAEYIQQCIDELKGE